MRLDIIGPGAVSDAEREILESIVADPTSITDFTPEVALRALKKGVLINLQSNAKANGITGFNDTPYAKELIKANYNPSFIKEAEKIGKLKSSDPKLQTIANAISSGEVELDERGLQALGQMGFPIEPLMAEADERGFNVSNIAPPELVRKIRQKQARKQQAEERKRSNREKKRGVNRELKT